MLKAIFSRVLWLARGTSMVLGLTVMLAVVLRVTTTSLAAVPGDPFKLGRVNSIDRLSALVGSASGALLRVDNDGGGPALSLEANAGRPPLTVNSAAGKATNLNADELDGKDSARFAAKAEAPGFDHQTVGVVALTLFTQNVTQVTVTVPADGFVVLTGSGTLKSSHTNGRSTDSIVYLTRNWGAPDSTILALQTVPASAPTGNYSDSFSITRVFPVTAGENTFYMTAEIISGGSMIDTASLTGLYVKTRL